MKKLFYVLLTVLTIFAHLTHALSKDRRDDSQSNRSFIEADAVEDQSQDPTALDSPLLSSEDDDEHEYEEDPMVLACARIERDHVSDQVIDLEGSAMAVTDGNGIYSLSDLLVLPIDMDSYSIDHWDDSIDIVHDDDHSVYLSFNSTTLEVGALRTKGFNIYLLRDNVFIVLVLRDMDLQNIPGSLHEDDVLLIIRRDTGIDLMINQFLQQSHQTPFVVIDILQALVHQHRLEAFAIQIVKFSSLEDEYDEASPFLDPR